MKSLIFVIVLAKVTAQSLIFVTVLAKVTAQSLIFVTVLTKVTAQSLIFVTVLAKVTVLALLNLLFETFRHMSCDWVIYESDLLARIIMKQKTVR